WFFLEYSLPQHRFEGNTRVRELDVRALLETEFTDQLHVLRDAIVEDYVRRRDGVLTAGSVKVEISELDLDFFRIGNRRVSRDEGAVGPGRGRHKDDGEQCRDALNRSLPRRRTSSMRDAPSPVLLAHTRGGSSGRQRGCGSSARPEHP